MLDNDWAMLSDVIAGPLLLTERQNSVTCTDAMRKQDGWC